MKITHSIRLPSGDTADVCAWGGQVLSWRTRNGRELLYLSPKVRELLANDVTDRPLRGGIPVCFPQFAARGTGPKHGLVRQAWWYVDEALRSDTSEEAAELVLRWPTTHDKAEHTISAHAWELILRVTLRLNLLNVSLEVCNTSISSQIFTGALHTYLAVESVRTARLLGCQGLDYEDGLRVGHWQKDQDCEVLVEGELERFYANTPQTLTLRQRVADSAHFEQALSIQQHGFEDTVVWNPGPVKVTCLDDMPAKDWMRMLCVEAAQVQRPVRLNPGEKWVGSQTLMVLP